MVGTRCAAHMPPYSRAKPVATILAWVLVIFALALVSGLAVSMVGAALVSTGPLRHLLGIVVALLVLLLGVRTMRDLLAARQGTK